MSREAPLTRADFPHFLEITTRWMDNDVYGHVNNVVYYSFFDTVVNRYLIDNGALDFRDGKVIGLVVETQCNYFKPVAYPDRITAALAVEHLGNSSVRYRLAVFSNDDDDAAAQGHFVHVYVDRATNRPVPLPDALRKALERIAK
ncbi:MAG TPA: thioesterase family protein [Pseudolabrys sp.]|jgi:acyl-CoA thioester hydrolase|nr:thioesterase family protein [Pseudolabrys sp.]